MSNIGLCVQNLEGLIWGERGRICAVMVWEQGRTGERSKEGVFWRSRVGCALVVGACGFAPRGAFKWLVALVRGVRVALL